MSTLVIIVWYNYTGTTYPTYLQKLKSFQNRAIKTVVGGYFRDSVNSFCSQLKNLQIDDLIKFEVAKFVYGSLNNKTANSFRKYACKTNDRSSQATNGQYPELDKISN